MTEVGALIWSVAIVIAALTTPLRGLARLLSPEVMGVLILAFIFGYRPLAENRFQLRNLYGYTPAESGQDAAVLIGIVFAVGVSAALLIGALVQRGVDEFPTALGSTLGGGKRKSAREKAWRDSDISFPFLISVTMMGIAAYVALTAAIAGPSFIVTSLAGRSDALRDVAIPEPLTLLPMSGSLAATYLLCSRGVKTIRHWEWLIIALAVTSSLVTVSLLGNRRYMIPCLLAPILARVVHRQIKLRARHAAALSAGAVVLASIPYVRSEGARGGQGLLGALVTFIREDGVANIGYSFVASYDTEMFDYVALRASSVARGESLGLGRGTVLESLTRPLPESMGLFGEPYSDVLLQQYFGSTCGQGVCPVPSLVGVLYFDGGMPLVAVGSVLFAISLRWLSRRLAEAGNASTFHSTIMCVVAANVLVAVRTQTVHAMWWTIYMMVICVLIHQLNVRRKEAGRRSIVEDECKFATIGEMS